MTTPNSLFRSILLSAALTCLGVAAAFAGSPNAYLSGTYVIVNFAVNPESDLGSLTYDGAGNFSGTYTDNTNGTVTTLSISGTYTVASDGSFTATDSSNGHTNTGQISADGNVIVASKITSGQGPTIFVAVKYGGITNLNVASGLLALASDTTGATNTAAGYSSLTSNTSGANNTAFGANALYSNTTGKGNAAQGVNALYNNNTGIRNLGIGSNALYDNTTGSYNIALGFDAGYNVTTGSNNIEIGTSGTASDNGTIQIGSPGTQTFTSIAGIYGTPVTGSAVYVTSSGQLGVQASSERFKTDIATMPELSAKLSRLRPVTFHYKTDPKGVQQYGLIAEEVDKVYPELVIRDETGKIQGVHYEELAPMLLGEVQKQRIELRAQQARIAEQVAEIRELKQQRDQYATKAEVKDLRQQLQAALKSQTNSEVVARR